LDFSSPVVPNSFLKERKEKEERGKDVNYYI
jgi:hypothetical protein